MYKTKIKWLRVWLLESSVIQKLACKRLRGEEEEQRVGHLSTWPVIGCCRLWSGHRSPYAPIQAWKRIHDCKDCSCYYPGVDIQLKQMLEKVVLSPLQTGFLVSMDRFGYMFMSVVIHSTHAHLLYVLKARKACSETIKLDNSHVFWVTLTLSKTDEASYWLQLNIYFAKTEDCGSWPQLFIV